MPDVEAALNTVQNHCFIAQIEFLDGLSAFVKQLTKAVGTSANPGPVLNDFNSVGAIPSRARLTRRYCGFFGPLNDRSTVSCTSVETPWSRHSQRIISGKTVRNIL